MLRSDKVDTLLGVASYKMKGLTVRKMLSKSGWLTLVALALLGLSSWFCLNPRLLVSARSSDGALFPATDIKSYNDEINKSYDFKFGPNPFAPGNATTTTGTFLPGDMFVSSKRCGTCHTDAHAQWRHRGTTKSK